MEKPRLRNVQAIQTEINGRKMLLFQDPERVTQETVAVPAELAAIIQFFDGNHTVRDIQAELMRITGQLIDSEQIGLIVQEFDEHLLLDSDRFAKHVADVEKRWQEASVRPPALAGSAYPDSSEECRSLLDGFYEPSAGPGRPGERTAHDLKGIIAPHIDVKTNGSYYAHAYKVLAERSDADVFFLLGTAHYEAEQTFIFCEKDFATPLGVAETDRDFIRLVKRGLRDRSSRSDSTHRTEHSLEFQVLFLQHLFEGKKDFKIIPLLVGAFHNLIISGDSLSADPLISDFIGVVRDALSEYKARVCFIAGADLAHLGPRYGDKEAYTPMRENEIKADDDRMMEPLMRADAEGFLASVAKINDSRHVCGTSPVATMVALMQPTRGELIKWGCWFDSSTSSAVSFASMAFY